MIDTIYLVIESLIAIQTVLGNAFVISAFCVEKKLRRKKNYYIISLAVANFLAGFPGIPSALLVKHL